MQIISAMKKTLLLFSALALGTLANAQTYFSQNIGNTVIPASAYDPTGVGSVKLPSGNFLSVTLAQSGGFEMKQFAANGNLLFTSQVYTATHTINSIYSVNMMGTSSVLIAGLCKNASATPEYYIASINILTNQVKISTKPVTYMSYTSGPKVSVGDNDLYVVFPDFQKFDLSKYDLNLNPKWSRTIEGDSISGKNPGTDCDRRRDSTIIVVGKCDDELGWGECDSSGECDTMRLYRGGGYTRIYGMTRTSDDNFIVAGLFNSYTGTMTNTPIIAKLGEHGEVIWAKLLDETGGGTFARFVDVVELPDGRICGLASTYEAYNNTYFDGIVLFDANGTLQKSIKLGDATNTYNLYDAKAYDNGLLLSGNILVNGTTYVNHVIFTDFDLNQICHQSTVNHTVTNHNMGTVDAYDGSHISNAVGTVSTTATYGTLALTTNPSTDFCTTTTGVNEVEADNFVVYPNPVEAGNTLTIQFEQNMNATINLIDITGKIVMSQAVNSNTLTVATSNLNAGAYLINVIENGKVLTSQKLMVK
jgi:uncharacterized protein YegP (UPF0339 family)